MLNGNARMQGGQPVARGDPYQRQSYYPRQQQPQQQQPQPQQQQRPLREYDVLHLASFTAGRASRLSPEEGLHKLQQMESSTGLWEMQCCLQLTQSALHIVDRRNGELMEQFPLTRVRQPVAFEGGGGPRGYDSVLLFSIEEPTGTWEMHIFNCPQSATPAPRVAKEIHQLLQGERLPAGQSAAAPPPIIAGRQQQQQQQQHNLQPGRNFAPTAESRLTPLDAGGPQQQQHKDSERLVHILNRCFDEIEAFVGQVGEAGRARQMLQSPTQKSGSAQSRGLLQMRARMPPTEQFVETLKMLKLVLNLLGRLEGQIHQPNAPELVHFLFTPLTMLVDSLGGVDLPARVLSPLLTRQPQLRHHHQQQQQQFGNLEADLVNKQQQELRRRQMTAAANAAVAAAAARQFSLTPPDSPPTPPHQQQHRRQQQPQQPINAGYYPNQQQHQHQQHLQQHQHQNRWEEQQEQLRREAEQRGSRLVQAIHDKTGRNAKELSVRKGEILEVLDDSRNWWQLRNCVGEVGHAPYTILRVL